MRSSITYFLVSFGFASSNAFMTSFETLASLSVAFSALPRASLQQTQKTSAQNEIPVDSVKMSGKLSDIW